MDTQLQYLEQELAQVKSQVDLNYSKVQLDEERETFESEKEKVYMIIRSKMARYKLEVDELERKQSLLEENSTRYDIEKSQFDLDKAQLQHYIDENNELRQLYQDSKSTCDELKDEIVQLGFENASCQDTINSLMAELEEQRAELEMLCEKFEKTSEEPNQVAHKYSQQIEILQEKLTASETRVTDIEEELNQCSRENENLQSRLNENVQVVDELSHKLSSQEREIGELNQNLRQLNQQLDKKVEENSNLNHNIHQRDEEIIKLNKTVGDYETNAQGLQQNSNQLASTLQDRDQTIQELNSKLESMMVTQQTELENVMNRYELDIKKMSSTIDDYVVKLDTCNKEISRLNGEVVTLGQNENHNDDKCAKLENRCEELIQERIQMATDFEVKVIKHDQETALLKDQVQKCGVEIAELTTKFQQSDDQNQQLLCTLDDIKYKKQQLEEVIKSKDNIIQDLTTKLANSETNFAQIKANNDQNISSKTLELEKLTKELNAVKFSSERDISQLTESLTARERFIAENHDTIIQLKQDLDTKFNMVSQLSDDLTKCNASMKKDQIQISKLQHQNEELQVSIINLQDQNEYLQSENDTLNQDIMINNESAADNADEIRHLRAQLSRLQQHQQQQNNNSQLQSAFNQYQSTIALDKQLNTIFYQNLSEWRQLSSKLLPPRWNLEVVLTNFHHRSLVVTCDPTRPLIETLFIDQSTSLSNILKQCCTRGDSSENIPILSKDDYLDNFHISKTKLFISSSDVLDATQWVQIYGEGTISPTRPFITLQSFCSYLSQRDTSITHTNERCPIQQCRQDNTCPYYRGDDVNAQINTHSAHSSLDTTAIVHSTIHLKWE